LSRGTLEKGKERSRKKTTEKLKYQQKLYHMEPQTEKSMEKEVEIIECLEFKSADLKYVTKKDQLYHALRYLQTRLEVDHGNKIHICKAKNAIVIRGFYTISTHIDLCANACLYTVDNNCKNVDNALDKCLDACRKFIKPYSHVVLVENYRKLIEELTHHVTEFDTKFSDYYFEIVIRT